jgi:hypothetical protein
MAKKMCPKCKGKGCSHCGGTGYHNNMYKGGMMGKKMNEGMKALKKAAPEVAKKMGYKYGGMTKKKDMMGMGMAYGGMTKMKGYKHGGMACGADVPAERPIKKSK